MNQPRRHEGTKGNTQQDWFSCRRVFVAIVFFVTMMSLGAPSSWFPIAAAQGARAAVVVPMVTGPVPVTAESRPFLGADHGLPPMDLAKRGYVEEEFFVSGSAN